MASASVVLTSDTSGSVTVTVPSGTALGTTTLTLPTTGGTIQTSGSGFTTNGVAYASSTSALTTGTGLTFNGTQVGINTNVPSGAGSTSALTVYGKNVSNYFTSVFYNANASNTTAFNNRIVQIASSGSGADTTIQFTDSVANNAYLSMNSGSLLFATGGSTETMRLDSSGNLLVGTTTASGKLTVVNGYLKVSSNTTISSGTGTVHEVSQALASNPICYYFNSSTTVPQGVNINFNGSSPNNTASTFLGASDNSASRLLFYSNGGIGNYTANNVVFSDKTLKKNITSAKDYLSILNQIPVVTYLYNDQTDADLNLGVIAQDVQAVAPELVTTINSGTENNPNMKLGIYETDLKYAMLKAIQELSTLITAQSATITSLTERITALEGART
jgi:hypothetical protein